MGFWDSLCDIVVGVTVFYDFWVINFGVVSLREFTVHYKYTLELIDFTEFIELNLSNFSFFIEFIEFPYSAL